MGSIHVDMTMDEIAFCAFVYDIASLFKVTNTFLNDVIWGILTILHN